MPPTERTTLDCPQCSQPADVEIWQLLDLGREPDQRRRFLQGEINALRCDHCGAAGLLPVPLIVHDPAQARVIFFIPEDPQMTPEMAADLQQQMGNALLRTITGPPPNYLFRPQLARDPRAVAELLAEGLDDDNAAAAANDDPQAPYVQAVLAFINANSWSESRQIVEQQRDLLLSETAEVVMQDLLDQYRDDANAVRVLTEHRELLRRCRAEGITTAFAEKSSGPTQPDIPPELTPILQELSQPARLSDMPRRVELCRQALGMVSRAEHEPLWAALQNELGNSLVQNPQGHRAENIEQAIGAYEQALEVRSRAAMPVEWAQAMMNLGTAYRNRIRGERAENIEQAIGAYEQALEIQTIEQFPADHLKTQRNLGQLYFDDWQWPAAQAAYQSAIESGQHLLETAFTEAGRQAEIAETGRLFSRAAYAALQQGQWTETLLTLEQGKARLLAEALNLSARLLEQLPPAYGDPIEKAAHRIKGLEQEARLPADTPGRRAQSDIHQELAEARTNLHRVMQAARAVAPDLLPAALPLESLLALPASGQALVFPLFTPQGSAVIVIPAGQSALTADNVLWLDEVKESNVQALLQGPADDPRWGGWLGAYFNFLNPQIRDWDGWCNTIEETGSRLWALLGEKLHHYLQQRKVSRVLFLSQGGVQLLPLHAMWRLENGRKRYWLDDYIVSYAPGGRALAAARQAVEQAGGKPARLLAVSNPTGDAQLTYTPAEVEAVAAMFPAGQVKILAGAEASRNDILTAANGEMTHFHFSGHGQYDWNDPQNSGLVCADRRLTLHTIQRRLDLNQTRLVSLSACETGMVDLRQSPDEFIGLPAGFMAAGAPAVLSTLWAVGDLASMLLVERFYEGLLQQQLSPPEALRQAQRWLRDVTAAELADRFTDERLAVLGLKLPPAIISEGYHRFVDDDETARPFREPYYWAGFVFNGA